MPVLDALSGDYADQVAFLAVAWKSRPENAAERAAELMPSGNILWGLDNEAEIFELYGVRSQPVSVLITANGEVVDAWFGVVGETEIRAALERLLDITA